jgi:hypothetical protein
MESVLSGAAGHRRSTAPWRAISHGAARKQGMPTLLTRRPSRRSLPSCAPPALVPKSKPLGWVQPLVGSPRTQQPDQ